jgi:hypothetical protein
MIEHSSEILTNNPVSSFIMEGGWTSEEIENLNKEAKKSPGTPQFIDCAQCIITATYKTDWLKGRYVYEALTADDDRKITLDYSERFGVFTVPASPHIAINKEGAYFLQSCTKFDNNPGSLIQLSEGLAIRINHQVGNNLYPIYVIIDPDLPDHTALVAIPYDRNSTPMIGKCRPVGENHNHLVESSIYVEGTNQLLYQDQNGFCQNDCYLLVTYYPSEFQRLVPIDTIYKARQKHHLNYAVQNNGYIVQIELSRTQDPNTGCYLYISPNGKSFFPLNNQSNLIAIDSTTQLPCFKDPVGYIQSSDSLSHYITNDNTRWSWCQIQENSQLLKRINNENSFVEEGACYINNENGSRLLYNNGSCISDLIEGSFINSSGNDLTIPAGQYNVIVSVNRDQRIVAKIKKSDQWHNPQGCTGYDLESNTTLPNDFNSFNFGKLRIYIEPGRPLQNDQFFTIINEHKVPLVSIPSEGQLSFTLNYNRSIILTRRGAKVTLLVNDQERDFYGELVKSNQPETWDIIASYIDDDPRYKLIVRVTANKEQHICIETPSIIATDNKHFRLIAPNSNLKLQEVCHFIGHSDPVPVCGELEETISPKALIYVPHDSETVAFDDKYIILTSTTPPPKSFLLSEPFLLSNSLSNNEQVPVTIPCKEGEEIIHCMGTLNRQGLFTLALNKQYFTGRITTSDNRLMLTYKKYLGTSFDTFRPLTNPNMVAFSNKYGKTPYLPYGSLKKLIISQKPFLNQQQFEFIPIVYSPLLIGSLIGFLGESGPRLMSHDSYGAIIKDAKYQSDSKPAVYIEFKSPKIYCKCTAYELGKFDGHVIHTVGNEQIEQHYNWYGDLGLVQFYLDSAIFQILYKKRSLLEIRL